MLASLLRGQWIEEHPGSILINQTLVEWGQFMPCGLVDRDFSSGGLDHSTDHGWA
jgi:hypothetical protein